MNICNIETDITDHCNLTCSNCSHHSPYVTKGFYDIKQFQHDIDKSSEFLSCNWFKLLGGEPLLNESISEYVTHLRRSDICKNIAIFTNGILLNRVSVDLLMSVDCVVVSRYPGNTSYTNLVKKNVDQARKHVKVIHNFYDKFEAQEFTHENDDKELVKKIFDRCRLRYECNAIYKGHFYKCMACQRKYDFLKANNIEYNILSDPSVDGVAIHEPEFTKRFMKYYYSDVPLAACRFCTGSSGKDVAHINKLQKPEQFVTDVVCPEKLKQPPVSQTKDFNKIFSTPTNKLNKSFEEFIDNDGVVHKL